jgi:hypothetical protein
MRRQVSRNEPCGIAMTTIADTRKMEWYREQAVRLAAQAMMLRYDISFLSFINKIVMHEAEVKRVATMAFHFANLALPDKETDA